ncbi:flavodoxin family protein [Patescibacteria group bacterium]|nr:flavodoxin family protein [Patescibacteria group bacterium]
MAKGNSKTKILVAYASNSGNTRLTAQHIAERLNDHGFTVTVSDVARMRPADLRGYDVIVLGSCTWSRFVDGNELEAQLPEHMHRFVESSEHTRLPNARFAIFALGRHEYNGFAGAANHLMLFVRKLGGQLMLQPFTIDGFPHEQWNTVDHWTDELAKTIRQPVPTA